MKTPLTKRTFKIGLICLVLTIRAAVSYSQAPVVFSFNSTADTTPWANWGQTVAVTSSFIAGDAPAGQTNSTGALEFSGTFGPSTTFGGLTVVFPSVDATQYADLGFWVKQEGTPDGNGQIGSIQFNLSNYGTGLYQTASVQPTYSGSGWQHFDIPMSAFSASQSLLNNVNRINLGVYDGAYSASTMMNIAFDNIEFYNNLVSEPPTSTVTNVVIPRSFFGLHAMGYGTSPYPVPSQPYGLIRDWDHWGSGNVNWQNLEPSKGTFTWTAMDATVNAVTNQDVKFLHCFGAGPSWAGGTAPTNILDWDLFITNFVTRYHTKIKYLETWNEAAPGEGFYTGTTAMLVQMEHDLYTITKSIDPTVTVLTPDATGGESVVYNFFNSYFASGGTNCDAVAFHAYNSLTGVSGNITYPEDMIGIVGNLKTVMNAYGQGSKPIFATEGDWGTEGTGANQPTTNDAVAFMARQYLLLWSLGVSSYAWYDWENNNGYWQFGEMWDPTHGLNAAGIAYQQLYYWMVGAVMSQPATNQGSVYTCGFTRPGDYQALAVWNTNRTSTSTYTVPSGYVQYRDLAGNLYSISGSTVTIGIEPILLENMDEPIFSGLTSHTNIYGTASVTLTGTVSSYGIYPPSGTAITVSINGNAQTTTTSDATGDFSINYNTVGLPASATPYTVTYSNDAAGNLPAGIDTSTTLTIVARPELDGLSISGTQFIFSYPTVVGQTYQLQYATNLSSSAWLPVGSAVAGTGAPVWVTNSISSAKQTFYRLIITAQ